MQKLVQRNSLTGTRATSHSARYATRLRSYDNGSGYTTTAPESVGTKVEKWLKTPFDIAAFGPRVGLGALVSAPEKLQSLQRDVERIIELAQDPRPLEEKKDVVLKEVEENVVEFLEKGATLETDILANLKTVLPKEVADILNDVIPAPPNKTTVNVDAVEVESVVTYQQSDVLSNQVASEMTEIKNAVTALKAALDNVRTNTDISKTNIMRLNLREARDMLARRLQEVSSSTASDASITAATREARILLEEVDASFFS